MRLSEAIARFAQQMDADGKSIHTKTAYLRDLRYFCEWLVEDVDMASITPQTLVDYITQSANRQVNGEVKTTTSVNHVKSSLRSFFQWAFYLGHVIENPARTLRVKNEGRRIPKLLSPEDKKALLATMAEDASHAAWRDHVIVQAFLGTGMRLNELLSLNVDDVDLEQRRITLRKSKGGGQAVKPMSQALTQTMTDYLAWRSAQEVQTEALFISQLSKRLSNRQVQMRMKDWFQRAGLSEDLTVHSYRHSFASTLYAKTRNLLLVQSALDHKNVTTTQIYAHIDDAELAEAVELV